MYVWSGMNVGVQALGPPLGGALSGLGSSPGPPSPSVTFHPVHHCAAHSQWTAARSPPNTPQAFPRPNSLNPSLSRHQTRPWNGNSSELSGIARDGRCLTPIYFLSFPRAIFLLRFQPPSTGIIQGK